MKKKKLLKIFDLTFFTGAKKVDEEVKKEGNSDFWELSALLEKGFGVTRALFIVTWLMIGGLVYFIYLTGQNKDLKTIYVTHAEKISEQDIELEVCKAALENIGTSHICHKELFDEDTCNEFRNFSEPFSLDPKYFHIVGGWMRNGQCKVFAKDKKDGKPVLRIWMIKTHGKQKGFLIDDIQEIFGSALEHRRFNS